MENYKIIVLPEVKEFVSQLASVLLDNGYKITQEYADRYVDEIIDFIRNISRLPAHDINPLFEYHFQRYGGNLKYVFWKRGNTTWYVFFQQKDDLILVRHITNNWIEGQYIR